MRTRVLGALGAVTLGILGGAVALATPAAAVAPPTVAWKSLCDTPGGHVQATATAPATATDDDPIWIKIGTAGPERLPTTTGKKTVTVDVTGFTAITAKWSQDGTNFTAINAPATYTWSAEATGCLAEVKTTLATCENPYISVGISNPVGAAPIKVTLNGSTVQVNGGENAALDNTSNKIVWAWESTIPTLATHGFKGNGAIDYIPPTGCATGQPGAGDVKPSDGKRHHGKGRYQHVIFVPIGGENTPTGGGQAQGGTKGGGDTLPVTGTNTLTIAIVGTFFALAGAIALYCVIKRNRRIRFTAQ